MAKTELMSKMQLVTQLTKLFNDYWAEIASFSAYGQIKRRQELSVWLTGTTFTYM